jgi:hypothetical protein
MSILHLNKSVLTLHLREIVEDGNSSNKLALLGLSAIVFAPAIRPSVAKIARPLVKAVVKSGFSFYHQNKEIFGKW